MNMLYEGLKEKGALMLIPSSAVESMGMGGLLGAAALRQERLTGGGEEAAAKAGARRRDLCGSGESTEGANHVSAGRTRSRSRSSSGSRS